MGVTIRELSERSGVKIPTIRYYERQGLLPEPVRTGTGQRRYGWVDVARLRFVRFGRGLGLEVGEIRSLIEMVGEGEGEGEDIVVLAEAVAERAEWMQGLCVSLRSVSAAIIAGGIDEAGAFDRLIEGEVPMAVGAVKEPPAPEPEPNAPRTLPDDAEPPSEASVDEGAGPPSDEPVMQEPRAESVTERDASETSLPKPKRKRTRARS